MDRREAVIREKYAALAAHLTERGRRIWAATEAKSYGHGGITAVYQATGITDKTIRRGMREVQVGKGAEAGRIRQIGGGRKRLTEQDPTVVHDLARLVDPVTRGDPESPLLWTSKSTYHLSEALQHQGHPISQRSQGNCASSAGKTEELHQVGNGPAGAFPFDFQGTLAGIATQEGDRQAVEERHVLCRRPIIDPAGIFAKHHI